VGSRLPVLCAPFFTNCEAKEFTETGHRREERPDLPVSLLMVPHARRLEFDGVDRFLPSLLLFCCSRECRDEAALSESVLTGARVKER